MTLNSVSPISGDRISSRSHDFGGLGPATLVGQTPTKPRRSMSPSPDPSPVTAPATYAADREEATTAGSSKSLRKSRTKSSYSAAEYRSGGRSDRPYPGKSGATTW